MGLAEYSCTTTNRLATTNSHLTPADILSMYHRMHGVPSLPLDWRRKALRALVLQLPETVKGPSLAVLAQVTLKPAKQQTRLLY